MVQFCLCFTAFRVTRLIFSFLFLAKDRKMAQRVINAAATEAQCNGEKTTKLTAKESLELSRSIQKIVKR